jgi:hypothetical protein
VISSSVVLFSTKILTWFYFVISISLMIFCTCSDIGLLAYFNSSSLVAIFNQSNLRQFIYSLCPESLIAELPQE